jgi:hypothetical protein
MVGMVGEIGRTQRVYRVRPERMQPVPDEPRRTRFRTPDFPAPDGVGPVVGHHVESAAEASRRE